MLPTWLLAFDAAYGFTLVTDPLNLTLGTVGTPIRVVWSKEGDPREMSLACTMVRKAGKHLNNNGIITSITSLMDSGMEMVTFTGPGCVLTVLVESERLRALLTSLFRVEIVHSER